MTQIEKFHWKTEEAFNRIKSGRPVVLQECPIIFPHHENWTLDNLLNIIKDDFPCTVYFSPDKSFPYWDTNKNTYGYRFVPHFRKGTMTFKEFHRRTLLQDSLPPEAIKEYCYLNQSLVAEMGPKILEEYSKFSLQTAALYKVLAGWNEMMHNLLMCGKEGFTTPLHYDEVENIFTQLFGRKRVRLFPSDCWQCLYPFPVGHPRDRQCQVVLPREPGSLVLDSEFDRNRFPEFAHLGSSELYVDLEPGEMLYIPQYWFHQMEALSDNISLSWWFKHTSRKDIDYKNIDLTKITFSAVRRNIEGVMAHMMGGGRRAHELFLAIASGRVRIPGIVYKTAPSSSSGKLMLTSSTTSSSSSQSSASSASSGGGGELEGDSGIVDDDAPSSVVDNIPVDAVASTTTVASVTADGEVACEAVAVVPPAAPSTVEESQQMKLLTVFKNNSNANSNNRRLFYVASDLTVHDTDAGALYLRSSDDDKWRSTVDQALSMLRTLFPPEVAAGFLLQVAVGRFSALDLQQN